MILSPAERSYLYDSLSVQPPVRPDARSAHQFRPIEASCSFLPNSNGSSRVRLSDGGEAIVSVKTQVVLTKNESSLISIDVDINKERDDSNFIKNLISSLESILLKKFPIEKLKLTERYSFKVYIDCFILSHNSYPLGLLSLCIYLALKSTRLPLLTSTVNDREIEEQPTFNDDWEASKKLFEPSEHQDDPPLLFVVGIIGNNVFIDPSNEEEEVSENGLIVGFANGEIVPPVQSTNLSNRDSKGISPKHILKAYSMVRNCGKEVVKALNTVVSSDDDVFTSIY
ncbi:hypothetical protein PACTADRAFT_40037 [Pachysolen tannophilus NRRL Y-2460]|uniref:Ribosomal RNA-processing protein 42 n=1 Tax=Pachysolen tannophilus NRRL Y-2460 TaxID=669874 RepID=A0A1E4TYS6_PACTA|nr:hypothetical protein PACTADRAFT_40037 [Pachysolen tannophilus NRRL Y-2460]